MLTEAQYNLLKQWPDNRYCKHDCIFKYELEQLSELGLIKYKNEGDKYAKNYRSCTEAIKEVVSYN